MISKPIRLDLKNCLPSLDPGFEGRVGGLGFFFYFGEGQSRSQGLKLVCREKQPLSAIIVIIDSDKALVNNATRDAI